MNTVNTKAQLRAQISMLLLNSNVSVTRIEATSHVLLTAKSRTVRDTHTRAYSL